MGVPVDSSGATETRQNEQKCLQFKQNTEDHCQSSNAAALLVLKQLSTRRRKYMIWCRVIKAGGIGWGSSEMCYSPSNLLGNSTSEETVGAVCSRNILWVFKPILKTFKATPRSSHSGTRLILARERWGYVTEWGCLFWRHVDKLLNLAESWTLVPSGQSQLRQWVEAIIKNLRSSQAKINNQRPREDKDNT